MIDRITDSALKLSLLLASIGSLLSLAKMALEHVVRVDYYWWSAVAFFGATIALTAAIRLRDDRAAARSDRKGDASADPRRTTGR